MNVDQDSFTPKTETVGRRWETLWFLLKLFFSPPREVKFEALYESELEKYRHGNVVRALEARMVFLSVFVDDIMIVGKKQNSRPPWKRVQKHIDLEDPTPLTDQEH